MKRILIVDDAAFMRVSIRNIVVKHGFDVVGEAANGTAAVQQYASLRPDVVTMDITMPEMNGLDALREIRKMDPGASVIMVSALGQESLVRDAVCAGAKGFVVKPFKEETIVAALTKVG
ncbi:response regulator [Christensenellaceae bacterium OttesenSCG-928-L17]|nr:response regulator [Christensenellaceae bacterium OttesenSCG-928-L17]